MKTTNITNGLIIIVDGMDIDTQIAESAYYKAEQRGFELGYEITDWLESEKEILTNQAELYYEY